MGRGRGEAPGGYGTHQLQGSPRVNNGPQDRVDHGQGVGIGTRQRHADGLEIREVSDPAAEWPSACDRVFVAAVRQRP